MWLAFSVVEWLHLVLWTARAPGDELPYGFAIVRSCKGCPISILTIEEGALCQRSVTSVGQRPVTLTGVDLAPIWCDLAMGCDAMSSGHSCTEMHGFVLLRGCMFVLYVCVWRRASLRRPFVLCVLCERVDYMASALLAFVTCFVVLNLDDITRAVVTTCG